MKATYSWISQLDPCLLFSSSPSEVDLTTSSIIVSQKFKASLLRRVCEQALPPLFTALRLSVTHKRCLTAACVGRHQTQPGPLLQGEELPFFSLCPKTQPFRKDMPETRGLRHWTDVKTKWISECQGSLNVTGKYGQQREIMAALKAEVVAVCVKSNIQGEHEIKVKCWLFPPVRSSASASQPAHHKAVLIRGTFTLTTRVNVIVIQFTHWSFCLSKQPLKKKYLWPQVNFVFENRELGVFSQHFFLVFFSV